MLVTDITILFHMNIWIHEWWIHEYIIMIMVIRCLLSSIDVLSLFSIVEWQAPQNICWKTCHTLKISQVVISFMNFYASVWCNDVEWNFIMYLLSQTITSHDFFISSLLCYMTCKRKYRCVMLFKFLEVVHAAILMHTWLKWIYNEICCL